MSWFLVAAGAMCALAGAYAALRWANKVLAERDAALRGIGDGS